MKHTPLLASAFLACILPLSAASKGTLVIGHVTVMTGTDAYYAPGAVPALEDEVAKINAAGGINGYQLKVISYDSQSQPAECVAVTKRLIDQDKAVAIIGPHFSGGAIPMAKIADESHVPIIATTATNVNVTVDVPCATFTSVLPTATATVGVTVSTVNGDEVTPCPTLPSALCQLLSTTIVAFESIVPDLPVNVPV